MQWLKVTSTYDPRKDVIHTRYPIYINMSKIISFQIMENVGAKTMYHGIFTEVYLSGVNYDDESNSPLLIPGVAYDCILWDDFMLRADMQETDQRLIQKHFTNDRE